MYLLKRLTHLGVAYLGVLICLYFYVHLKIYTSKEKVLFQESGS